MVRRSRSTSARRRRRCGRAPYQPARVHALPSVCRLTHARRAAIPQKKPKDEEAEEGGAAEPASAAADDDDDDAVLDFSKKKKKKPVRTPRPCFQHAAVAGFPNAATARAATEKASG